MTDDNDKQRMKDVDHTHPYDDTSAGALFARGPVVVADGGERAAGSRTSEGERSESSGSERNAVSRSSSEPGSDGGRDPSRSDAASDERGSDPSAETMRDVDHTSPHGEEEANRIFERGDEQAVDTDTVEE